MADCLPTLMGVVGCQVLLAAAPGSAIILPRYSSGTHPMSGQQAALSGEFLCERERKGISPIPEDTDHLGSNARWALVTWSDSGVLHSLTFWQYRNNLSHRACCSL